MKDGITIAMNLHRIAVEQDFQETLLEDEKCTYCGRELMTGYSRKTQCCGLCSRKGLNGRPTTHNHAEIKGARAEKQGWDTDFNKGHGERFLRAFDTAFNLTPILLQSLSTEQLGEATSASMKEGLPRNSKLGTRGMGTAEGSQPRSSRGVLVEVKYDTTKPYTSKSEINTNINAPGSFRHISEDMLGKAGESRINFPYQPYSVARSITAGFEPADRGSNPLGVIPARLFLSENRFSLQDIGGQTKFSGHDITHIPLLAEQKHAGIFLLRALLFKNLHRILLPMQSPIHNIITVIASQERGNSLVTTGCFVHEFPKADNE